MNSVVKIVARFSLCHLSRTPRRFVSVPSYEAALVSGRCLSSNSPTSLEFEVGSSATLEMLRKFGITSERILQKVVQMPVLSGGSPDAWNTLLSTLLKFGFSPHSIVSMTVRYSKLLTMSPESLNSAWAVWLQFFHQHERARDILKAYPIFFSLDKVAVQSHLDLLRAITGSGKSVASLLEKCPQIMFRSLTDLQQVSDYISTAMVVRNAADYSESIALGCTLKEIKTKHTFLVRCGKYKTPNLKQSDKIPTTNPSLSDIFNTAEDEFAKIAGVTLEEFVVFRTMYDEEIANGDDSDEDSDSDDSDDE